MNRRATKQSQERDVTDHDERWCLIKCGSTQRYAKALEKQCEHKDSRGQYVVHSGDAWCFFEPATKMQALSWVNGRAAGGRSALVLQRE